MKCGRTGSSLSHSKRAPVHKRSNTTMTQPPQILVADDDRLIRLTLEAGLSMYGFRVSLARSGREALQAALEKRFDGIISDVYMADGDGLMVLRELRSSQPETPIILMTAVGSVNLAVRAIEEGATDFIAKPFEVEAIADLLRRHLRARVETDASSHSFAAAESVDSAAWPEDDFSGSGLIGRSPAMVKIYKLIAHAARMDATVLVTGESGAGKELTARAIHDFSARRDEPFIAINCSGLTDTLLEAELFGHAKGAFTGATGERAGLFEAADGGTLFLDELASTTAAFQASLLRVLQSGEVRRVGSTQSRRVNVRVIGASNAPLRDLVAAGTFRADLYYRLSVLSIELPPLRERAGDIELLTAHFLQSFSNPGEPLPHLTREASDALNAHDFPGNVRELENALRRAVALSTGGVITIDCLPPEIAKGRAKTAGQGRAEHKLIADRPTMAELERRYLQFTLEETG